MIKYTQFCGVVREKNFQLWLGHISPDLYQDLIDHLKKSTSCKSNIVKVKQLEKEIEKLGLTSKLIDFLTKHYPLTISNENEEIKPDTNITLENDKKVFSFYNPRLLTFPQKMIFTSTDSKKLTETVKQFISDKVNCDYVIIKDKAYVEYFHRKYSQEARSISKSSREIFKYKLREGIHE